MTTLQILINVFAIVSAAALVKKLYSQAMNLIDRARHIRECAHQKLHTIEDLLTSLPKDQLSDANFERLSEMILRIHSPFTQSFFTLIKPTNEAKPRNNSGDL